MKSGVPGGLLTLHLPVGRVSAAGCNTDEFWDVDGGPNYGTPGAENLSENDPTSPDFVGGALPNEEESEDALLEEEEEPLDDNTDNDTSPPPPAPPAGGLGEGEEPAKEEDEDIEPEDGAQDGEEDTEDEDGNIGEDNTSPPPSPNLGEEEHDGDE
jgi:hypothetical protein